MIIPVKCFTCGKVIGSSYRTFQEQVMQDKRASQVLGGESTNIDKVVYLTKEFHDKTIEGRVLDKLNILKMCCRRHMLTHVDID